jgi:hypothetical protein
MSDFRVTRGDSASFTITVTVGGVPLDLRLMNTALVFAAREIPGDAIVLSKSIGSGITVEPGNPGNVATLKLDPGDTSGIDAPTILAYDVQLTEPDARVTTVVGGRITITPDISS